MKYLKTYEYFQSETGQYIDYQNGDIVICSDDNIPNLKAFKQNPLKNGVKYKVLNVYKRPEDKFILKKDFMRVDVENLETGEISRGWESTRFKTKLENAADQYNL